MLRGYRSFVLAVVGFLAFAGALWTELRPTYPIIPTSEYQKAGNTKYSPGSPACYPSRLGALPDREAADEKYRCEQAADEYRLKNDDLVQQTRNADAAVALVGLTYNQSLMMLAGTIFGLLTLIAAFAAVLYAKRAADAAEKGLGVTKAVAAADLRAWVAIDLVLTKFKSDAHGIDIDYEVVFKNIGQTAARNFQFHTKALFVGDRQVEAIDEMFLKWKEPRKRSRYALMPGEERQAPSSHMTARSILPWAGAKPPHRVYFIVIGTAFYWSHMDEEWHRTDRSFTIGRKGGNFYDDRFLFDDMIYDLAGDELGILVVKPYRAGETT